MADAAANSIGIAGNRQLRHNDCQFTSVATAYMSDSEKAAKVVETLKAAEREPPPTALLALNELAGLIQGGGETPLEVEEARASAFMAICEVAKALHRGTPATQLWSSAVGAAERWRSLAG